MARSMAALRRDARRVRSRRDALASCDWKEPRIRPVLRRIAGLAKLTARGYLDSLSWLPEGLREVIAVHALDGGSGPRNSPALYAAMPAVIAEEGAWVPEGGLHELVLALARLAEAAGAELGPASRSSAWSGQGPRGRDGLRGGLRGLGPRRQPPGRHVAIGARLGAQEADPLGRGLLCRAPGAAAPRGAEPHRPGARRHGESSSPTSSRAKSPSRRWSSSTTTVPGRSTPTRRTRRRCSWRCPPAARPTTSQTCSCGGRRAGPKRPSPCLVHWKTTSKSTSYWTLRTSPSGGARAGPSTAWPTRSGR